MPFQAKVTPYEALEDRRPGWYARFCTRDGKPLLNVPLRPIFDSHGGITLDEHLKVVFTEESFALNGMPETLEVVSGDGVQFTMVLWDNPGIRVHRDSMRMTCTMEMRLNASWMGPTVRQVPEQSSTPEDLRRKNIKHWTPEQLEALRKAAGTSAPPPTQTEREHLEGMLSRIADLERQRREEKQRKTEAAIQNIQKHTEEMTRRQIVEELKQQIRRR